MTVAQKLQAPVIQPSLAAADRGTWRAKVRKYVAITRINLQNSLAYAWDALTSGFFIVLFVFIFAQLWKTTFDLQNTAVIGGLTLNMTIWYFVWAELIELSKIKPAQTIQDEVQNGTLAYTLGRPYNYVLYHFFFGAGGVLIRMFFLLIFGSITAILVTGPLDSFRIEVMPAVLLITALAFILDYCIQASLGLLAFFFEDTAAFRLIYQKIVFVMGGLLIPIDFLPDNVQSVARLLPFNLVVYGPSKLFIKWDVGQFWQILGLQIIWIAIMAMILNAIYQYGAKRVTINGG